MFKAIVISKPAQTQQCAVRDVDESEMHDGDVTFKVDYSTINYKDGLAITGKAPVVRKFPMVPGIDGAGTVTASSHARFAAGDKVILNGWGVGERHWGCLGQQARVKGDWLIKLPVQFTTRQAMAIGTAGYTAMLCVLALEQHRVTPDNGEVLVTGAAGGVGSIAIALLAKLGYQVVASTGRSSESEYLKSLGAVEIIDRATLAAPGKPLSKERWAGAVDTVGSHTLANVCAGMRYRGTVAACGLAGGMDFPSSVAPFILRGVTLAGIDSVMAPQPLRVTAWTRLARDLDPARLEAMTREVTLENAIGAAAAIIAGKVRGRMVVDVNA